MCEFAKGERRKWNTLLRGALCFYTTVQLTGKVDKLNMKNQNNR